ncbi:MAG: hypothetical protein E6G92_02290 [Alphaproteobacteria bacterium]|nr:MAG: hypothetical protein E6G92_02290 [Alphaproteobacteria bacterium]
MIATAIAMLLSMQASDTTRASREAFTRCLGRFVDSSMEAGKTAAQFSAEFPQACATEQSAFRNAIIARDTASRSTRASAEESANAEIEDARFNFNDRFQGAQPPQVAAASTPAGQPAAQTAAQTTPAPAAQQASQPH